MPNLKNSSEKKNEENSTKHIDGPIEVATATKDGEIATTDDQSRQYSQWEKESKEIWITNLFVDRPISVLSFSCLILLAISVAAFSLGYFDQDPQSDRDFLIWDDPIIVNFDKLFLAKEYIEKYGSGDGDKPTRLSPVENW